MSGRITYGLSGISGNPNANFNIDIPNGNFTSQSDAINPTFITTTSSVISTWDSGNTITVKTVNPTVEFYTADKCGLAQTSNSLVAIANGEVGLELKQNETEIDRLLINSSIIRQYETISLASQNYNISASSPKTYLIEPGSESGIKTINTTITNLSIAISPNQLYYAITGLKSVRVYTAVDDVLLWQDTSMNNVNVNGCAFSPDNGTLAICTSDNPGRVRTYNSLNGTLLQNSNIPPNFGLNAVRWIGNDKLVCGGENAILYVISSVTLIQLATYVINSPPISDGSHIDDIAVNAALNRIVVVTKDSGRRVIVLPWTNATNTFGTPIFTAFNNLLSTAFRTVSLYDSDTKIIAAGEDDTIRSYNISDLTTNWTFSASSDVLGSFALNNFIYTISANGIFRVMNGTNGNIIREINLVDIPDNTFDSVQVFQNGRILIARSNGLIYSLTNYTIPSIRFNNTDIIDGTTYSFYNMSNGSIIIESLILPGSNFYQNLTNYSLTVQPGTTNFIIPRFSSCHIKVCKISNVEIYFFVNMTPNIN